MKNFLLLFLLSVTVFISCKKDNTVYTGSDPDQKALQEATVVSTGKFVFADERADDGIVKIYLRKDGKYVLGLENMNYRSVHDTDVYLSNTTTINTTSIKVFSAQKLYGNVYYIFTFGVNPPSYKYIVIQSDTEAAPAASAALQ